MSDTSLLATLIFPPIILPFCQWVSPSSINLENEDGNLVYVVEIGQQEVVVDAGNGRVLYNHPINQEDDQNAVSRPKSSIQVPNTNGSDYGSGQSGG